MHSFCVCADGRQSVAAECGLADMCSSLTRAALPLPHRAALHPPLLPCPEPAAEQGHLQLLPLPLVCVHGARGGGRRLLHRRIPPGRQEGLLRAGALAQGWRACKPQACRCCCCARALRLPLQLPAGGGLAVDECQGRMSSKLPCAVPGCRASCGRSSHRPAASLLLAAHHQG